MYKLRKYSSAVVDLMSNRFKVVWVSAAASPAKMVNLQANGHRPIQIFPKPLVGQSCFSPISWVKLGVPCLIKTLGPSPTSIRNYNNFPKFVPIRKIVKSFAKHRIGRTIALQSSLMHRTKPACLSALCASTNGAGVKVFVWHDYSVSYADPLFLPSREG